MKQYAQRLRKLEQALHATLHFAPEQELERLCDMDLRNLERGLAVGEVPPQVGTPRLRRWLQEQVR